MDTYRGVVLAYGDFHAQFYPTPEGGQADVIQDVALVMLVTLY